ncbi:MAG: FkbM family methyltransferase [Acidobacteriota bacterium]
MDYSNPLLRYPRYLARKSGILGLLERTLIKASPGEYEAKLAQIMSAHIRPGDVVWDVGANHGHFTAQFADAVGASGTVVAFEPAQGTFRSLTKAVNFRKNVRLENSALGDSDGTADLYVSAAEGYDYDISHLAVIKDNPQLKSVSQVSVVRGDTYRDAHPNLAPHRIKIDVEGFEYEVLLGLSETLKSSQLLSVFIEVHFTFLREKGTPDAPARIVSLLKADKFLTQWVGPCHLVASR